MPKKKYSVVLSPTEESFLKSITHTGKGYSARELIHAQVLLHSNDRVPEDKKNNRSLAEWLGISPTTVNQIRKTYALNGLEFFPQGPNSIHHKRSLVNAVLYLVDNVCKWRALPHDFPPYSTVHSFYRRARISGL